MIGLTVLIEIILFVLASIFCYLAMEEYEHEILHGFIAFICGLALFIVPMAIGSFHGYVYYNESNDKDLARITAVTQEQDYKHTYYKVEVEYLTNTPQQQGLVTNNRIEKDVFYCYYQDKELVQKLKNNMYKELWIISGYKGGYETWTDFGTKLIKDIELKEE